MQDFSDVDLNLIKNALNHLMQDSAQNGGIITGFNYYYALAHPSGLLISINYQHRNQDHLEAILEDLRKDPVLSDLLLPERTAELKLTRDKRAVYFFRKDWPLPKDKTGKLMRSVELFNFYTEELLDRSKLDSAETVNDIPIYRDVKYLIALRELDGIEFNLNVKTAPEACGALKLFRTKGFRLKMTETGLTYYEQGKPVYAKNPEPWPDSDKTPCIILGKQISDFFPEGIPDFKKVHKIALIRGNNELSFCIHKKYQSLLKHAAYEELKKHFGASLQDVIAYANNAFVIEYIDTE